MASREARREAARAVPEGCLVVRVDLVVQADPVVPVVPAVAQADPVAQVADLR